MTRVCKGSEKWERGTGVARLIRLYLRLKKARRVIVKRASNHKSEVYTAWSRKMHLKKKKKKLSADNAVCSHVQQSV
jgi:hypothetical protein